MFRITRRQSLDSFFRYRRKVIKQQSHEGRKSQKKLKEKKKILHQIVNSQHESNKGHLINFTSPTLETEGEALYVFIRATKRSGCLQGKGKYWSGFEDRPRGLPLCSQVREICRPAMCINKRKACVIGGKKTPHFMMPNIINMAGQVSFICGKVQSGTECDIVQQNNAKMFYLFALCHFHKRFL